MPGRAAGESSGGIDRKTTSYAVWPSAETCRGLRVWGRIRTTPGASGTWAIAAAAAVSNAGVPAVSVGLWSTTTTADGGVFSSSWRRALARADSRSSRMKPPARSAPTTRGARGSASSRTTAHAATIHHRRRTANRPSRANGSEAASTAVRRLGDADMTSAMLQSPRRKRGFGDFRRHDDPGPRTRHRPRRQPARRAADPRAALRGGARGGSTPGPAQLVAEVARDQPAQHVSVFVPDAVAGGLRLVAQIWGAGEDTGEVVVGEWIVPFAGSVCGRVYRTGAAALCADVALDPDYRGFPGGHSRSSLTVPVGKPVPSSRS